MATLKSLFSNAVQAAVPTDVLDPDVPTFGNVTVQQNNGVPFGRTVVTLNWTAPTQNERIFGEYIGTASGAAQSLETQFDPVAASPAHQLYEVTAKGGSGKGSSTATAIISTNNRQVTLASVTNFAVNDYIEINDGTKREYNQIASISGNVLTLNGDVLSPTSYAVGTTVKTATVTLKTITTDYTITLSTGVISIVSGRFTNTNDIFIVYTTTLQDLAGFELYRVPGNLAQGAAPERATVLAATGLVTVSTAIAASAVSYTDTLTATENGETWSYYLFAKDDEATPNYSASDGTYIETVPSVPQNLRKQVSENRVQLFWDAIGTAPSDANTDGFNVYRNDGNALDQTNLKKLNSALIAKASPTFDDVSTNVTNRVSAGSVPYPVNGNTYTYVVESEDTVTGWTTGTQNQTFGVSSNTLASKAG